MGVIEHNNPLVKQLIDHLGIPADCRAFNIRVAMGEIVTVTCEYFPTPSGSIKIEKFKLIPLEGEEEIG